MFLKKIFINLLLFTSTFLIVSLLAFPILFDFIFSILILIIFRKKYISIVILNFLIVIMVFAIDLSIKNEKKYEYFFRAHEKYKTKKAKYQKNISETISMPYGDIYFLDSGLNNKRELIKVPRIQKFITDSYGIRNDEIKIEEAEIILVGDSFITANGTTQEDMPSNILSKISGKKVAILSYGGLNPTEYELLINKYLKIIKPDAKIFVFYFAGNDFVKIEEKKEKKDKSTDFIYWRGYEIPRLSGTIRFAYERLERNKDKFLLKILSEKNYFLRTVRAKSHLMYRKFFSKLHNTGSPIQYFEIGKKTVGFFHTDGMEGDYITYIFRNEKVLKRVNGFFYIPIKFQIYSDYIDSIEAEENYQLKFLKDSYSKINKPVYDLTKILKTSAPMYLSEEKYLYWRDDTHWNYNGIYESMKYLNSIIQE